jgi:glycosyltransferase involved in cell wall biosynthesis
LISAALIAPDEEPHVGACLQSIAEIVDEVTVVDKGSCDSSREIAATCDGRVVDYQWDGDFPATRDYAINQVTGERILYIDADEQARASDGRFLRHDPPSRFPSAISRTILLDVQRIIAVGQKRTASSQLTIDQLDCAGTSAELGLVMQQCWGPLLCLPPDERD